MNARRLDSRLRSHSGRPGRTLTGDARLATLLLVGSLVAGCGTPTPAASLGGAADSDSAATSSAPPETSASPDWYRIEMTDVRSGETFAIGAFAGKVVLIETMAVWCPTCVQQQAEMIRLHELLGDRSDLVSISLDVDLHEDETTLAEYATMHGYDWRFAVAPLDVARALGNLYSAQYLNPPLAPMLLIDRNGAAEQLPFGVKTAEILRDILDRHLAE